MQAIDRVSLMRLLPQQINIIRQTVAEIAGDDAKVRLFGSRRDDKARGGDIDLALIIFSQAPNTT